MKALACRADLDSPNEEDKPGYLGWDGGASWLHSSGQSWSHVSKTTA